MTVPAFGRYAVIANSAGGTALQLLDRIAAPGAVNGIPGQTDGRLDVFLDRGPHKVVALASEKGTGAARLTVHGFSERNGKPFPLLVELKPVDDTLADFEQRSYGVQVTNRRQVVFEAAGRDLADLRLWSDGEWLVAAEPQTDVVTPVPGQPMRVCRLAATLAPGFYVLTAYGGVPRPWSTSSDLHPLHLRFGIPRLGAVGRARHAVSVFGLDRWLVPARPSYFRIELPEAHAATLEVGWFDPQHPFEAEGESARIDKNALSPVAALEVEASGDADRLRLVTVGGSAGQPYVLQYFDGGQPAAFGGSFWLLDHPGDYWVSTVHSGDPGDSIDATALIVRTGPVPTPASHTQPLAAQVVEMKAGASWARRCNLLDTATLFLHIESAGKYQILARGTATKFRLEPFFATPPPQYTAPELRGSGATWDLDAGYYVLTAEPDKAGIADLALVPAGGAEPAEVFARLFRKDRHAEMESLRAAAQFPDLRLERDASYVLFVNSQPDVKVGLVLRHLPLDLIDPLPVVQRPGETVAVPFMVKAPGVLRAEAEDGSLLPVSVDGGAARESVDVKPGAHRLEVRAAGPPMHYSIVVQPARLQARAALPSMPDPERAAPPRLKVIDDHRPQFFDLGRQADATFLLHADRAALYRLQSTGLLSTEGTLRTRTVASFDSASMNGVGHNFFIQQYLREGDYLVTVSTRGRSMGHLGLVLERTPLRDGGVLVPGVPAPVTLPAGQAVGYTFTVRTAGQYRLRSFGIGTTYRMRLEDADGWLIEPPDAAADLTRRFEAGEYRVISLPEPVDGRRITLLEPVVEPPKRQGHGPHVLPLATRVAHVWMEPERGAERLPDAWEFRLPAPVDARIDLTEEMQGTLTWIDAPGGARTVATLPPGRGWTGKLAMGRYRLAATCARHDNRHPYAVAVWPQQLVAGLDRTVTTPAAVPVSVGREALVELSSFGGTDVRARLYDGNDRLIASNDDGLDDWNFRIQTRLQPGTYRLQVDPVAAESPRVIAPPTPTPTPSQPWWRRREADAGMAPPTPTGATCVVSMREPQEIERATVSLPFTADVALGDSVQLLPLTLAAPAGLLAVVARAPEAVGVAVEAESRAAPGWRTLGSATGRPARLEMPLAAGRRYRLRLWAAAGRVTTAQVTAVTVVPRTMTEAALGRGLRVEAVPQIEPPIGAVVVQPDRPGLLQLTGGSAGVARVCTVPDEPCAAPAGSIVTAGASPLWLVVDRRAGGRAPQVRVTRLALPSDLDHGVQFDVASSRPAACDFAGNESGPVFAIATARAGQPGVRLVARAQGADAVPGNDGLAVAERAAAAVALSGGPVTALVWSADSGESIAVRLRQQRFAPPVLEPAGWGGWDTAVDGVAARAFALPAGPKRIRLALPGGTAAVLSEGQRVASADWRGDEPFEETIEGSADRLTVLHLRSATAQVHVEVLPLAADALVRPLAVGAPYERPELRAGILRLTVAPAAAGAKAPRTVHVRTANGAVGLATLLGADGRIRRGRDLPLADGGGTLLVAHGSGLVLAWIDRAGDEARDLWGGALPGTPTTVTAATVVPLTGRVQALRFDPRAPVMLHVRGATPSVTLLERGAAAPIVEIHATGTVLDAYLDAEPAVLGLRAIGSGALSGSVEVTTSPVTPIGEGLGPEVVLAAGATRLFSFTVAHEGPLGIGVRADPDVVDCTLLDAAGNRIGGGVVQMPTLKPGAYLLAVHAPADSGPVRARPALAGLQLPSTAPPADVVQYYLKLASGRESTPAPSSGDDDDAD